MLLRDIYKFSPLSYNKTFCLITEKQLNFMKELARYFYLKTLNTFLLKKMVTSPIKADQINMKLIDASWYSLDNLINSRFRLSYYIGVYNEHKTL